MAWLLGILLLDEGVGDGLHAVLRADEHHRSAPAHHQAQLPRVLCELVLVVGVCGRRGAAVMQCGKVPGDVPGWEVGCGRWGEGRQAKLSSPTSASPSPLAASLEKNREAQEELWRRPCAACPPSTMRTQPWGDGLSAQRGGGEKKNPSAGSGSSWRATIHPRTNGLFPAWGRGRGVTVHGGELPLRDYCTMGKAELGCHSPLPDPKDNSSPSLPIPSWSCRDGSGWLWAWGCSGVRRGQKLTGPASWDPM